MENVTFKSPIETENWNLKLPIKAENVNLKSPLLMLKILNL